MVIDQWGISSIYLYSSTRKAFKKQNNIFVAENNECLVAYDVIRQKLSLVIASLSKIIGE